MTGTLEPILRPRAVAVVGASRRPGTIGHELVGALVRNRFAGPVYPVNPAARAIGAVPAWPDLASLPEAPDLVVVAVPKEQVLDTCRAAVDRGAGGLVVISAGFREVGPEGAAREAELTAFVRGAGIRMVGPNCMGVLNTDPAFRLNATFAPQLPPAGRIGFVSQSGAMGLSVLDYARVYGIGISQFVSVGNKPDVSGNDVLLAWENDPTVEVILMYVESFGNPRRFLDIAARMGRRKPIIVVKSGSSRAGARAASSHTGALAASDAAVTALLEQAGVLRARSVEELFDLAMAFGGRTLPRSRRTAVVTNAGGPGILAADALEGAGLELAELAPATVERLRPLFPPEASLRNPLDMIASATPAGYRSALGALLDDPGLDAILAIFVPPLGVRQEDVTEAIAAAALTRVDTPVYAVLMGHEGLPQGRAALHEASIPAYIFPESAARAIAALNRYREWRERPPRELPAPGMDDAAVHALLAAAAARGAQRLSELEAIELVRLAGARVAPAARATTPEEAVAAAERLGWPVVCKVMATAISHKTEADGVQVGLRSPDEVRQAWDRIHAGARRAAPHAVVEGVLVQRHASGGPELIVGASREPGFGPLLMVGLGGVLVEVLRDVVFRLAPVTPGDAADMLDALRGRAILDGVRGAPPSDRDTLIDLLVRLGHLMMSCPAIAELDLNPVLAGADGALVLDARVALTPNSPRAEQAGAR